MEGHVVKSAMWHDDQPLVTNQPRERRKEVLVQNAEILIGGLIELLEVAVRETQPVVEFFDLKFERRDCRLDVALRSELAH